MAARNVADRTVIWAREESHLEKHMAVKVLMIEDNLEYAEAIQGMLHPVKATVFQPVVVDGLEEGLARLEAGDIDLVLLALNLASGEALERVHQASAAPVLLLGSAAERKPAMRLVGKGAQDFLPREELTAARLEHALCCALARREPAQEYERFNNLQIPVLALDRELRLVYCNMAYAAISGFSCPRLSGKKLRRLFPSFDERRSQQFFQGVLQSGEPQEVEAWVGEHYYSVWAYPAPRGLLVLANDVTARKQLEQALSQAEERYHGIFDGVRDAILVESLTGEILDVNASACEMFGYTREEFLKKTVSDVVLPEFIFFVDGKRVLDSKAAGQPFEAINILANGEHFPVEISLQLQNFGNEQVMLVVVRDITERKRAAEDLQHSEAHYRLLAEAVTDVIGLHDAEGGFLYVGPSVEKATGWAAAELVGKNMLELVHPEDRQAVKERIQSMLKNGDVQYAWRCVHKDGSVVWMETNAHPIPDAESPSYRWLSVSRDVGERIKAARSLEAINEQLMKTIAELEQRNREATLLNEMGDILQSCLRSDEVYNVAVEYSQQLFPQLSGRLYILNQSKEMTEAVASWGENIFSEVVFTPEACWGLRRGRVHLVSEPLSGMRCRHLSEDESFTYLCAPLIAQGEVLGMLYLQGDGKPLQKQDKPAAIMIAERVALALSNLNLRESLHAQSVRDPLTGLFNRRYMNETMERELHRAARHHLSVGIIMIDIDRFKPFNDTYGHDAGDAILQALGRYIQYSIRGDDVACRYGGDEFMLILPQASLQDTMKRAKSLCEGLRQLFINHGGLRLGGITVSMGVAAFPDHGETMEILLRAADRALYRAKEQGRDQVVRLPSE